jgi:hypothetical protein
LVLGFLIRALDRRGSAQARILMSMDRCGSDPGVDFPVRRITT